MLLRLRVLAMPKKKEDDKLIIRILGLEYEVKPTQELHRENNVATIQYHTGILEILSDIDEDRTKEALLHEIIEALNYQCSIGLEHRQIQILSSTLYPTLKDNGFKF